MRIMPGERARRAGRLGSSAKRWIAPSRDAARAGVRAATLCAGLLLAGAPLTPQDAHAASFTLSNGLKLEGEVTAASQRFVTIETAEGKRLVSREAVLEVSVRRRDGVLVRGRLEGWRDGAYELLTENGVISVSERGVFVPEVEVTVDDTPARPRRGVRETQTAAAAPAPANRRPERQRATTNAPATAPAAAQPPRDNAAPGDAAQENAEEETVAEETVAEETDARENAALEDAASDGATQAAAEPSAGAELSVAAITAQAAPASAGGEAPTSGGAEADEAWMRSPSRDDDGEDRFQVLLETTDDPGAFDNRDQPSGLDTSRAELEAPDGLPSAAPPTLALKSPAAPTGPRAAASDVDRGSDPELVAAPEPADPPDGNAAPAAQDRPADVTGVRTPPEAPPFEEATGSAIARLEALEEGGITEETLPAPSFDDPFGRVGGARASGDGAVRDLLSGLLSDEALAPTAAPLDPSGSNPRSADPRSADPSGRAADRSAPSGENSATAGAAGEPEGPRIGADPPSIAAPDLGAPPDAAPAPAEVATLTAAPEIRDPAAAPADSGTGGQAPRLDPAAPSAAPDPFAALRDPSLDYLGGVFGEDRATPERAPSCARLTRLLAPPLAAAERGGADRADPAALTLAIGGDFAEDTLRTIGEAFYRDAGVAPGAIAAAPGPDGSGLILTAATERLIRPWRLAATPFSSPDAALASLTRGRADVALAPPSAFGAPLANGETRLIGFDAVALVAHPDNPLSALTRSDINGLLSGSVFDWSMIEPTLIGRPTLYLPPAGSNALDQLAAMAEVRRIRPASVRYIPDPRQRVQAALADPMGLAVAALSATGDAETMAIGRRGAGVQPTLDTLRSGAYPVAAPLYASLDSAPAHPAARLLAAFLSRPEGQRALFEAGVTPIAACDPSTCRLTADGLADARERLSRATIFPRLTMADEAATRALQRAAPPLAALSFPAGTAEIPPETVTRFAETLRRLAREDPEGQGDYAVLARAGLAGEAATPARLERARSRAEATALALRCVGLKARMIAVDPRANSGAFERSEPSPIRVELFAAP
ncbi:MAG: substrate-binding domain-containing protein [Pseudomonadota bacterium]